MGNESEYQLPVQIDPNKELETRKNLALEFNSSSPPIDHTFLTFTSDNPSNPNSSQTTIHFTSSKLGPNLNTTPIHTANLVTSSESTIVHLNLEDGLANSEENNPLLNVHQQSHKSSLVQSSIGSAT